MRTVDIRAIPAPIDRVFSAAREVERWPVWLPHYRWVRMLEGGQSGKRLVEMAAWRPFPGFRWPTWWVSEMWVDEAAPAVRYRHLRGVTQGMEVEWRLEPRNGGTTVTIVHEWEGPRWPLIGRAAAAWVIGPVFVHGIASRTLAGIAQHLERMDG